MANGEDEEQIIRPVYIRIVGTDQEFSYATIVLTREVLGIEGNDYRFIDLYIRSTNIKGFSELGQRSVLLNTHQNELQIEMHFRTPLQMAQVQKHLQQMTGSNASESS